MFVRSTRLIFLAIVLTFLLIVDGALRTRNAQLFSDFIVIFAIPIIIICLLFGISTKKEDGEVEEDEYDEEDEDEEEEDDEDEE